MNNDLVKILVCDDHEMIRKSIINTLISEVPHAEFEEASNAEEVIEKFNSMMPNWVLLDVEMPRGNGIEVCKNIKTMNPSTKIIIITMHNNGAMISAAKRAGANGIISKSDSERTIIEAFQHLNRYHYFYASKYMSQIGSENEYELFNDLYSSVNELTETEKTIISLALKNFSNEEIASSLFITIKTLNNHKNNICRKLDLEPVHNAFLKWVFENKNLLEVFLLK